MCDDLAQALELNKEIGAKTTKGAEFLFKAAVKSMMKMNQNFIEYKKSEDARFAKHQEEAEARWNAVDAKLEYLQKSFDEYKTDATKYRLIVELIKALFGTTKRSLVTLAWFGVLMGLFHIKDIVDLLKVLI